MIGDIINTYFLEPLYNPAVQGYNLVNTLVFVGILLAVSFFLLYPQLNRRGIKFNFHFMLAMFPYILFGIGVRVIEDMGILPRSHLFWELGFWTVTPGIWIMVAVVVIAGLVLAKKLENKAKFGFHGILAGFGALFALPVLLFNMAQFVAWPWFFAILAGVVLVTGLVWLAVGRLKEGFFKDRLNALAVGGQAMDGVATVIATQALNCGEQHPLSLAILDVNGLLYILVKVALALLIVYYVDKEIRDKNLNGFIKVFITIIAFSTGTRNLFTVAAGTCGLG